MAAKKRKKKSKRPDWIKIKTEYVTSEISQSALAEKYGVSLRALNTHAKNENWVEEKEKNLQEIATVVTNETKKAVIEDKIKINERHIELYNKTLTVAEFLLEQYLKEIPRIKSGEIKKGKMSPYTLDFIASVLQKVQKGQRLALNIDNSDVGDNVEPEINIIEGIDINKI